MNQYKLNFIYSNIYTKIVLVSTGLLLILIPILFEFSLNHVVIFSGILIIQSTVLLYFLGSKRRDEIDKIRQLIKSIRKNQNLSAKKIKLEKPLEKLEDNIKAMLQKTQEDLVNMRKLEQTRSEFLGNVSHELRTPIFAIKGFIETLLEGAINDDKVNNKFLKKALRHTDNLDELLNDLIDISMIQSGQMRMNPEYFNLADFLSPIISDLESQLDNKDITIQLTLDDSGIVIFGDKDKIKAVFTNLLTNAIKYSEKGEIVISVKSQNKLAEIFIKDQGIGISNLDIDRIFERFYRVDKARSKEVGGSGLGLSIVKHILDAHGSKIKVESKLGKGSTFSFKIKVRKNL